MEIFLIIAVIIGLLILVLGNILIFKIIKLRAVKCYIKPFFDSKNLEIVNTKFVGFFDRGDFGKQKIVIKPVPVMGNIANDTYIYIYTQNANNIFRYTAKISTVFLFIKKVELKGESITTVLNKTS
nr:hypothetical protein [Pedobacter sp. ASV19]